MKVFITFAFPFCVILNSYFKKILSWSRILFLSIGSILANIFMLSEKFVSFCPCYGAEMRGGAVNCEINMSESELLCLQNEKVDFVIALNQMSFDNYQDNCKL